MLKVATIGEPPSRDAHLTTATITYHIAWHVYEGLYTYDRSYEPIPMLAERHTVSDEGRRYTIALRRGVKFHNGKELTSADVVASLQGCKLHTRRQGDLEARRGARGQGPYTIDFHR